MEDDEKSPETTRKHRLYFLPGTKGNMKIMYNGYAYFKNNARNDKTYWLCARNRKCKCRARLITLDQTYELVVKYQQHNHEADTQMTTSRLLQQRRAGAHTMLYSLANADDCGF